MYALSRGGARRSINIWPGFVDGLATLLLVVIFVLMVFMVAQFFLSAALTGRDEALERLNRQVNELAELLALERAANADLRINVAQLSSELQSSLAERESLSSQLSLLLDERATFDRQLAEAESERDTLAAQVAALTEERNRLARDLKDAETISSQAREELELAYQTIEADKAKIEAQLAELAILKSLRDEMAAELQQMEVALRSQEESAEALRQRLETAERELEEQARLAASAQGEADKQALLLQEARDQTSEQIRLTEEAQTKVDLLNRQIAALRQQLARLAVTLEAIEAANKEKDVQIADLGRRLNVALATKVQELSRYRSEFFGRLREILGDRADIRIVGDRFVFQAELLFDTGSAELGEDGKEQLRQLAGALREIAAEIPADLNWILRVDGHTDLRPIFTAAFGSNWELSTARALTVVEFLIEQGISPERLAATGFGEFQPLDRGEDEAAFRRNRRIEFKFTEK